MIAQFVDTIEIQPYQDIKRQFNNKRQEVLKQYIKEYERVDIFAAYSNILQIDSNLFIITIDIYNRGN